MSWTCLCTAFVPSLDERAVCLYVLHKMEYSCTPKPRSVTAARTLSLFFIWIFKRFIHLFYVCEYIVVIFRHTRRGYQIPLLQMVVSHHVVAMNWTQDLWKSSQCSNLLSHLSSPQKHNFRRGVVLTQEKSLGVCVGGGGVFCLLNTFLWLHLLVPRMTLSWC